MGSLRFGFLLVATVALGLAMGCGCSPGSEEKGKDVVAEARSGDLRQEDASEAEAKPDLLPIPDATVDSVGSDVTAPDQGQPDVAGTPLAVSYATFNTGLALNFVPLAAERLPAVVEAVRNLEAEFVCLQEVWEKDQVEALQEGTQETFPYSLFVDTTEAGGGGAPACTPEELQPLQDCVMKNCAEAEDLTGCVMQNCLAEFGKLQQSCTQCLAANLSKPLEEIFAACTTGSAAMSYEGRNGLLLLARREFASTEHLVLDSFLLRRVVLHATFKDDPTHTHVFCTHLSAALSEVEYGGKFESWEAEQAAQIDQVLDWMGKVAGDLPAVLMGDMNCGPALPPAIAGSFPDNFAKFAAKGYDSPYVSRTGIECTWCSANSLVDDADSDQIIDHVLIKGLALLSEVPTAERILDDMVEVTVNEQVQQTNLSDHFGIWVHYTESR